jgi:hypothetical protein
LRRGLGESPLARGRKNKKEWEDYQVGKDATEEGRSINKKGNSSSAVPLGETSSATFATKLAASEVYGSENGNGFSKPSSTTTSSYYDDIFFQRKNSSEEESIDNVEDTVVEQRVDVNNVISVYSSSSPSSFAHIDNGREETEGNKESTDFEALRSTSNNDGASTVSTKTPGIFRKLFGRLLK